MDMYTWLPEALDVQTYAIAFHLSMAVQSSDLSTAEPEYQFEKRTLKWQDASSGLDVSLLLTDASGVEELDQSTGFLRVFVEQFPELLVVVRETTWLLRSAHVVNAHGQNAAVRDRMKGATRALFLVALFQYGCRLHSVRD